MHNSVQVFTNNSNKNVIYKKAGLIFHVIHLKIFTGPPTVPSLQCPIGKCDDFVLLTCHKPKIWHCFLTSENKTDRNKTHLGTFKIILLQFSACCCQESHTQKRRMSCTWLPVTCSERLLLLCWGHCTNRSSCNGWQYKLSLQCHPTGLWG